MSDCEICPDEAECHYPYKPCDCVAQRKFWDYERRVEHDHAQRARDENRNDLVHGPGGQKIYG